MKTKYIRYSRIFKHSLYLVFTFNIVHLYEIQHYYYMKNFRRGNWFVYFCEQQNRIQKCYTEIWKTQMYPLSMKGKPKADDILKREFNFLKA